MYIPIAIDDIATSSNCATCSLMQKTDVTIFRDTNTMELTDHHGSSPVNARPVE
jgi:hypothetical protein